MSALELYTPSAEFPSITAIITLIVLACTMFFIQMKIYLIHSDELDRLKTSIDKRITALQADLDNSVNRLARLEDVTNTLLAAKDGMETELCKQEELLGEHGEEISLVGVAAYPNAHSTSAYAYHQSFDDYIKNYLRGSKLATVRQIFKHLSEDTPLMEEWPKLYGGGAPKMTRQHVNRRLYTLLAHGQLKMDSSAGPIVWSL
jgi:hypothetical protein